MKRLLVILSLLAAALPLTAREVLDINRNWRFFSDVETNSDGAQQVNLPHMWNNDALGGRRDYFRGTGNYLKNIDIPAEWSTKRIFLRFHGANAVANVFVNGRHAGEHRGGYTSFAFEITDCVRFGEKNALWVIVNNSPRLDILPTAGDATSYGGLFRDVELIAAEGICISPLGPGAEGVRIVQERVGGDRVEAAALIDISGVKDKNIQVHVAVRTDKGDTVARGSVRARLDGKAVVQARVPFTIDNPRLWNGIPDPYMYDISVSLADGSTVTDSYSLKTGFRSVAVDGNKGFLLNGRPYDVKGVVVRQDRAAVGTALTSYQVLEDFSLIREMGANAVRVEGVLHNPAFYELCDRTGMLVWSDMPLTGPAYLTDKAYVHSPGFMDNGRTQMREIVAQQFNHPSVVMWGIFSNLNMRGDSPVDYIGELNRTAKSEDPSRLTVAASNQDGDINFITDLIVWNQHFGWGEGMPSDVAVWLGQLRSSWGHLRSAVSYSAGGSIYHQDGSPSRPEAKSNWHPENWQTMFHQQYMDVLRTDDTLWGVFVCHMFDYGAVGYLWGEGVGVNDHGLVTFDRKYRKDAFYLYKANWNTSDPFVHITGKRWYSRTGTGQGIKVFTNRPEAELFVNGESKGVEKAFMGTIVWENVTMPAGINTVEVRSDSLSDRTMIDINPAS